MRNQDSIHEFRSISEVVPKARLELARCCQRGILNPLRLPFRHLGLSQSLPKLILLVQRKNAYQSCGLDPFSRAWS